MKSRTIFLVAFLLIAVTWSASAQNFSVDASVGLLYDFNSSQVLFAQQADEEWIPASLVKVMTMYVALDRIAADNVALDTEVVVSERAWRMGGSQMFLEVGDRVTLEDLLYGIAVVSGNDACVAIAEALAGTESLFIQWMNNKAKELGLNLHFVDVHGLSEDNRITARDFAILIENYLRDHPEALQYHSRLSFGYQPRSSSSPIVQSNRNGLLRTYEGADGLKTGFLSKAGNNLTATAKRDGRRLIAIVLGADSEAKREQEAAKLLDYGFRSFESIHMDELLSEQEVKVYKGRSKSVELTVDTSVSFLRGSREQLNTVVIIDELEAPIEAGEKVGTISVYLEDELLKEAPILAAQSVERGGWFTVLIDSIILFFKKLFSQA
jgi:D-alanyl-D-alanine carboxypeptidase (penicillin-binding protein 5/6)